MTEGESGEHKSQNSCIDQDLLALGCGLDLDIDRVYMEFPYQLSGFDSICEDESSPQESWSWITEEYLADLGYTWGTNQLDCDMRDRYKADGSNATADDQDKERRIHFAPPAESMAGPFCGLCGLGNLRRSSRDHHPGRYSECNSPDRSREDNKNTHRTWNKCHSTRTLISRSSESLDGTGRWLLIHERYIQWVNQPSSFLWLSGSPGAGKSVLMSTVIQSLEKNRQDGDLVAYYFANGYYQGVGMARAILCSILGQLLFRKPIRKSFSEILPLLNDLIAAGNPLSATRMIYLLSKMRHKLRSNETLYLLLDGLDEVTHVPRERELVLELIDHASRYDPHHQIKCFVSSRSTFFGERLPQGALRVDLDSHALNRNDMSLYVRDNLHKCVFTAYPSQDINDLVEKLLNSASGSFLVLRLLLEVSQPTSPNNNSTYKNFAVKLNDFREISVDEIYGVMLASIEDCNREAALSILRWVTFAARPLEPYELIALYKQTGIEVKEEDIGTISGGLLICSGNQIRFTHLSVREYLESQLSGRWEELSEEANEMIAHACLKLIPSENLLQSLSLSTKNVLPTKDTVASDFVHYAQTYWIFHYKRGERRSHYLAGLLHDSLEKAFRKGSKNNRHRVEDNIDRYASGAQSYCLPAEYRLDNFEAFNLVNTVLTVSAQFGFAKLAKLELDMGANLNIACGPGKKTPLCWAAKGGHLEVVELLLQRGADPNIASGSGYSPIDYAMANCHVEVQDLLMEYESRISQRSSSYAELRGGGGAAPNAIQELWLTAVITPSCNSCTASQVDYELRAVPGISNEEGKILPPILVGGETISEGELGISINILDIGKDRKLSTVVRWFPGVRMYHVLNSTSKRGIDDVRRLLLAAGNDRDSLDMTISLSKLLERW